MSEIIESLVNLTPSGVFSFTTFFLIRRYIAYNLKNKFVSKSISEFFFLTQRRGGNGAWIGIQFPVFSISMFTIHKFKTDIYFEGKMQGFLLSRDIGKVHRVRKVYI